MWADTSWELFFLLSSVPNRLLSPFVNNKVNKATQDAAGLLKPVTRVP